jgi:hypothetical protein
MPYEARLAISGLVTGTFFLPLPKALRNDTEGVIESLHFKCLQKIQRIYHEM